MSASLLDLIKAYGKAEADWAAGSVDYVPNLALVKVEDRIEAIRDAIPSYGLEDKIIEMLDGTE